MVGPGPQDVREAKILNRIVRFGDRAVEYEADQRHAELIVQALNLMGEKAVATPGERRGQKVRDGDEVKLGPYQASQFRAVRRGD